MMRAPNFSFSINASRKLLAQPLLASSLLALVAASGSTELAAQNSPGSFSLPGPSPTPTPAPQGPLDERSGVSIAPRVIPQSRPSTEPSPAPTATQAAIPTPTPTPAPAPTRSRATTPAPRANETEPRSAVPSPRSNAAQAPITSRTAPSTQSPNGPVAGPGFDTELIPDNGEGPIGPDDWYAVSPDGETGAAAQRSAPTVTASEVPSAARISSATGAEAIRNKVSIGLALIVLLSAALAWLFWRRRKQDQVQLEGDGPSLAFGVHKVIAQTLPSDLDQPPATQAPQPAAPAPAPAATKPAPARQEPAPQPAPSPSPDVSPVIATPPSEPARLDLALEILGGSRSLMMFSIDFRLDIANRSDSALRDLNVSGQLVCAQRGAANAAPIESRQLIEAVERVGPQQSRRVSGQLQLPLNQVKTIKQGSKPLFIPLLHIIVEAAGQPTLKRSFVIGNPSATSQSRVHPLPLDGPPGGLPGLRAQLVKQPLDGDTKTARSTATA